MASIYRTRTLILLVAVIGVLAGGAPAARQTQKPAATYQALPSETPKKFEPATDTFEYVKRDVMIPMRDGVKLHTVIIVPKGARNAPILLTRTPYNASERSKRNASPHMVA